jgi:hypothetical protein
MLNAKELPQYNYNDCPSDTYIRLNRIIFAVDKKEPQETPIYSTKIDAKAFVIPKIGSIPAHIVEAENLVVPTFVIAALPTWKLNETRMAQYEKFVDNLIKRGIESIHRQEDFECIKVLDAAIDKEHVFELTKDSCEENPSQLLKFFIKGIGVIKEHEIAPGYIVMHPTIAEMLFLVENKYLYLNKDVATLDNVYQKGTVVFGTYRDIPLLTNNACSKNSIYVTGSPFKAGIVVVKKEAAAGDIIEIPAELKQQCVVDAELGLAVLDDNSSAKILLTPPKIPLNDVSFRIPIPKPKPTFWQKLKHPFK